MKKCLSCGLENPPENGLCIKCGAVLLKAEDDEQIVLELGDEEFKGGTQAENSDEDHEAETMIEDFPSVPTVSAQKPRGKARMFVLGGIALGFLLLMVGAAGLFAYLYWNPDLIADRYPVEQQTPPPPANTAESPPPAPETPPTNKPEEDEAPRETAAATPETAFTPPVKPTLQGAFNVSAARGWQISDINTVSEEIFRTSVQGLIYLDGIKSNVPPEGVKGSEERRVYKEFPTGALLIRTRYADGKVSNIAHVTASDDWENYPNESGKLEFMVNDNAPEKNKGEFVVTVKLLK